MQKNVILEKLELNEEQLFSELGSELTGIQALPLSPKELSERGKKWFTKQYENIQTAVCSSNELKKFVTEKSEDAELVAETAKLLASLILPVNPINVAVILVKKGLRIFCKPKWSQNATE
jgi:hypothetical protein